MKGIYCYVDLKSDKVVYVGKDSHIYKNKRHHDHLQPCQYDKQQINRVLQNNPERYSYRILKQGNFSENLLNALEIIYIKRYSPRFNFTKGGEGTVGHKHSKETLEKISGKNNYNFGKKLSKEIREKMSKSTSGKNNPMYGKHHSEETRRKISENLPKRTGKDHPMYGRKHSKKSIEKMSKSHSGKIVSADTCRKMSEAQNNSGYFRVSKVKSSLYSQGFTWRYKYYVGGKRKTISNVDIKKLEERVKEKGLEWFSFADNNVEGI